VNPIRPAGVLGAALVASAALGEDPGKAVLPQCRAELVAEAASVRAGTETTLAVALKPEPGWHLYWKNPGESGLAPAVEWTLPAGWTAGALQWPVPHRVETDGIVAYAYEGETLLLVTLKVPAGAKPGEADIAARVTWLVCKDTCVPGEARIATKLRVGDVTAADAAATPRLAAARERMPRPLPAGAATLAVAGDQVSLTVADEALRRDDVKSVEFFPAEELVLDASAPASLGAAGTDRREVSVRLKPAPRRKTAVVRLQGVLVVRTAARTLAFDIDVRAAEGAKESGPAGERGNR
jgi:thiol:disulfide interchange protein DsbD